MWQVQLPPLLAFALFPLIPRPSPWVMLCMADSAPVFALELNLCGDLLIGLVQVCHSTSIDVSPTCPRSRHDFRPVSDPAAPLLSRNPLRRPGGQAEAADFLVTHTPSETILRLLGHDHLRCNPSGPLTEEGSTSLLAPPPGTRSRPPSPWDEVGRGRGSSPSAAGGSSSKYSPPSR